MESSQRTIRALRESLLSAYGCALIALAIIGVLSLNHTGPKPSSFGIHNYLIDWVQAGHDLNLAGQRIAHIVALLLCASLVLTASALSSKSVEPHRNSLVAKIPTAALVCFCGASAWWWFMQPISKPAWIVTGLLFLLAIFKARAVFEIPYIKSICTISMAVVTMIAVGPGIAVPYDASWMSPVATVEFQEGYSVVASQGDQIAMGKRIFEEVKPHYGILLPVLCGLFEKANGLFSFGQLVQIVRILQSLNVVLIFAVYSWYARMKALPFILALLMVIPWLHANQISILFPNLSAWRNIGFAVAALALALTAKLQHSHRAFVCGILSALCLSLNQEIGVAISVGFTAFLYFSDHTPGAAVPRRFLRSLGKFALGICTFLITFYCFLTLALGYLPNLQAFIAHLNRTQIVSKSGYLGGFQIEFNPMVSLVFVHYCYVLLRTACSEKTLTFRQCFRAFAATTGLVWFAYYFNRPHEWYFQPQFFLYGFVLIDTVRTAQTSNLKLPHIESKLPAVLLVVCSIIPQVVLAFDEAWVQYRNLIRQVVKGRHVERDAVLVSDLFISSKFAKELKEKANYLKNNCKEKSVLVLTGNTMLIPRLSGCHSKFGLADPFQELFTGKLTDEFVTSVKASDTTEVLIDAEECYLNGGPLRQHCWQNLEQKLRPEFVFEKYESGWKILTRRISRPATPN